MAGEKNKTLAQLQAIVDRKTSSKKQKANAKRELSKRKKMKAGEGRQAKSAVSSAVKKVVKAKTPKQKSAARKSVTKAVAEVEDLREVLGAKGKAKGKTALKSAPRKSSSKTGGSKKKPCKSGTERIGKACLKKCDANSSRNRATNRCREKAKKKTTTKKRGQDAAQVKKACEKRGKVYVPKKIVNGKLTGTRRCRASQRGKGGSKRKACKSGTERVGKACLKKCDSKSSRSRETNRCREKGKKKTTTKKRGQDAAQVKKACEKRGKVYVPKKLVNGKLTGTRRCRASQRGKGGGSKRKPCKSGTERVGKACLKNCDSNSARSRSTNRCNKKK